MYLTLLIPLLGRLGHRDCYEFELSIGHIVSNRLLELHGETERREERAMVCMFLCVEQQNLLL